MNKIYGLHIDKLRICYEVVDATTYIDELLHVEVGTTLDLYEFQLKRIDGKNFEFVYEIGYTDWDGISKVFGELRLGVNKNNLDDNTHLNGTRKAWIDVRNRVFYTDELYYLDFISDKIGLVFHNITHLDIAMDMSMNISNKIKSNIRNKKLTTILNGKKITNRKEDRPEIIYEASGDMDRYKYITVYIKQKNAIKDKSKGSYLRAYNKQAEIINSSHKEYINELYGNPDKIYRIEVHLNNEQIKEYLKRNQVEINIYDITFLYSLFLSTLNSLIRWEYSRYNKLKWEDIIAL